MFSVKRRPMYSLFKLKFMLSLPTASVINVSASLYTKISWHARLAAKKTYETFRTRTLKGSEFSKFQAAKQSFASYFAYFLYLHNVQRRGNRLQWTEKAELVFLLGSWVLFFFAIQKQSIRIFAFFSRWNTFPRYRLRAVIEINEH